MKIEVEILNILNEANKSNQEININLNKISKSRRGDNKLLIFLVQQMLSIHALPLTYVEEITIDRDYYISERNYDLLDKILQKSQHIIFNAVCSEILWKHKHKKLYAEKAISNYNKLTDNNYIEELYPRPFVNVCRVYSKIKHSEFNYREFFEKALTFVRARFSTENYCNLFVLTSLSECNLYSEEIKKVFYEIIEYYENESEYQRAIHYLEDLYNSKNLVTPDEKQELINRIARNYEKDATAYDWSEAEKAHTIVHLIQTAMSWWNKSKSSFAKDERKRLAKSIEPVKKLTLKNLQEFSTPPIDISDWIKDRESFIKDNNISTVILGLVEIMNLENSDSTLEDFKKSGEIFSDFFETNIIDNDGRIKCKVPPLSKNKNNSIPFLEYKAKQKYDNLSGFIHRYLVMAKKKFEFREDEIDFLILNNAFIPENRAKTFQKGLIAGFNYDYATALQLLMPQVENSIRCIAESCGAVVYKTDEKGVEESLSLETILNCPELCECLDETLLFNIRLFYISPHGYGMRNEIAHSFLSDDELNSYLGLTVWWFTLRVCCIFSPTYLRYYNNKFHIKEHKQ